MPNHELDKQVYCFAILAVVVIVALDRMSNQTVTSQMISGSLVALTIFAYVTSVRHWPLKE